MDIYLNLAVGAYHFARQVEMGSLNMSVVELDEPRHVRQIATLIQEIQFKRDLLQVFVHFYR